MQQEEPAQLPLERAELADAPVVPTASPAPEDCVRELEVEAARRWTDPLNNGPASAEDFTLIELPDLDGDGAPDHGLIAESKACGASGNCLSTMFFSNHGCPRYADTLWMGWESAEAETQTAQGVHGLRVWLGNGCAGQAGEFRHYAWSGTNFELARTIECICLDEQPEASQPAECRR